MEFVSKTLCRKCIWNFNTTAKYLGTAFFLHNHCQTIFYDFQSLFSLALLVWFSMPLPSHFSLASGISVTLEDPLHLCLPHHPHQFCVSGSRAQHWARLGRDTAPRSGLFVCCDSFAFILHQVVSTKYQLGHLGLVFNSLEVHRTGACDQDNWLNKH